VRVRKPRLGALPDGCVLKTVIRGKKESEKDEASHSGRSPGNIDWRKSSRLLHLQQLRSELEERNRTNTACWIAGKDPAVYLSQFLKLRTVEILPDILLGALLTRSAWYYVSTRLPTIF